MSGPAYIYVCIDTYIVCADCMPVPMPHATGAYIHPIHIPSDGARVGDVVGLGEDKSVGSAVVGVAVVGAMVVIAANRHSGHNKHTAVSTTTDAQQGSVTYPTSAQVLMHKACACACAHKCASQRSQAKWK